MKSASCISQNYKQTFKLIISFQKPQIMHINSLYLVFKYVFRFSKQNAQDCSIYFVEAFSCMYRIYTNLLVNYVNLWICFSLGMLYNQQF